MTRNSIIAVVLIVILRLAIGWQLLYEGLWKIDTLDTPRPWTSAGYLKNSQGPMRNAFRSMAGDPNDLDWLNYDVVAKRWDDWADRFESSYGLSKQQASKLHKLLNGSYGMVDGRKVYASDKGKLIQLPNGIEDLNKKSGVSPKVTWFDAEAQCLYVDGAQHMKDGERDKLLKLVQYNEDKTFKDDNNKSFYEAVDVVFKRQKRGLGFKEKLAGAVKGNPDLLGNQKWQRVGQKKEYEAQLARYEQLRSKADTDFQWDHLGSDWGKIQSLRAEVTAPVKALESELQDAASKLLSLDQMNNSPETKPWTMLKVVDVSTMAGLTVLGLLLLFGFFTRFAAVAAAFMLFNFYLAMPPFPGVPDMPGPEHSFIVNKNLIEIIALLAIAALPTGYWFGIDSWVAGRKARKVARAAV